MLTPLKVIALVVFLAALAGATYGVGTILGDSTAAFNAQPLHATLNGTAGHDITYALRVTNRGGDSRDVVAIVTGLGTEARSSAATAFADGNTTVFVTFAIPNDTAPGDHALAVRVVDEKGAVLRERPDALMLHVLPNATGFQNGDSADVVYTGRIAETGNVFGTNDIALQGQTFPRANTLPPSIDPTPLTVDTVPRVTTIQGFYEGLLGMQPGETRSVTFPPEKGYGNATIEQRVERETQVPRVVTRYPPSVNLTPADFTSYLDQTGQGNISDYHEGSLVTNTAPTGEVVNYRIVAIDADLVRLILDVHEGEHYTLYDAWPDASIVVATSNTSVTFRTDPPQAIGQNFTFYSYWPNMSALRSVDNATITVTHTPTEGLHYTKPATATAPAANFAVARVEATDIVVTTANPETTLGGKTLTFDITMLALRGGK